MKKTFGEIAKSHGFDSVSGFFKRVELEIEEKKLNAFKIGDIVILPEGYKPTHFETEKILPVNKPLVVSDVSTFTLDSYSVKIEGFGDVWFNAEIFESDK